MYCKYCGKEVSDNAVYCKSCGKPIGKYLEEIKQNPENSMSPKKRRSPLKIILCIILIGSIVIVGANLFLSFYGESDGSTVGYTVDSNPTSEYTVPEDILEDISLQVEDYYKQISEVPSDIEGWSVYDKYKYGLCTANGSDTDGDGLTDKEEIEIYNSDPLKMSTAGDMYTDGYKVENGLDLFAFVQYDGSDTITDDSGAISLKIESPKDVDACVVDMTGEYRNGSEGLYENTPEQYYYAYQICDYYGDLIKVELSPFAEALGMDTDDLNVEFSSIRGIECETKREDDAIFVKLNNAINLHSDMSMNTYGLFITGEKDDFSSNYSGIICLADNEDDGIKEMEQANKNKWGPQQSYPGLTISCSENATDEDIEALLCAGELLYYLNRNERISLNKDDITLYKPEYEMSLYSNGYYDQLASDQYNTKLTNIGPDFKGESLPAQPNLFGYYNCCYVWYSKDYLGNSVLRKYMQSRRLNRARLEENDKEVNDKEENKSFGVKDEFSFKNIGGLKSSKLDIEIHGLCAGMAQVAAEVYNYGAVQRPKDTCSYSDKKLEYNIEK